MSLIIDHPAEAVSQITDDLSATTKSSFRTLKDKLTPEESDNTSEQDLAHDYFNRLANVSDGVGVVAMQLFLKSLRCQSEKDKESGKHREQSTAGEPSKNISSDLENSPPRLVATLPKRPPLPELHQDDLYLLYSLLLHGDMTVLALAKSLGDSPQVVNNRVQILRNTGLIEQKAKVLKVNPAHYPALRRELARNNFMIQVP